MRTLKQVLMDRDKLTSAQAEEQIELFKNDLYDRIDIGEMPFDIMEEYFGLEPDYLEEFI